MTFFLAGLVPHNKKVTVLLHIRQEQIDELNRIAFQEFHVRIESHLRDSYPELIEGLTPEALSRKVEEAAVTAKKNQIEIELDLCEFVVLTFELGPHFELQAEYNWAKEILADSEMTPAVKIMQINARLENDNQPLATATENEIAFL